MLFSKAIIQAEWEANAPLRQALAIKPERLRALRAKRAAKAMRRGVGGGGERRTLLLAMVMHAHNKQGGVPDERSVGFLSATGQFLGRSCEALTCSCWQRR